MIRLLALFLLIGLARADEAPALVVSGSPISDPSRLVMRIPGDHLTFERWPAGCHLELSAHGDLSIAGEDVRPCAEVLETAARLARASQRVNHPRRKR